MKLKYLLLSLLLATNAHAEHTLLCLGDSVTIGRGIRKTETFCAKAAKSLDMPYINAGEGGTTTRYALEHLEENLATNPSYVTIMFGLNDSYIDSTATTNRVPLEEFQLNIKKIIHTLTRKRIRIILLTPNPTSNPYENTNLKPYVNYLRAFVRQYSKRHEILLLDVYASFAEREIEGIETRIDGVHPTKIEHALIADSLKLLIKNGVNT